MAGESLLFSDSGISLNKRPPCLAIVEQGTGGLDRDTACCVSMKREELKDLRYDGHES